MNSAFRIVQLALPAAARHQSRVEIVVIGGTGRVGSELCASLLAQGHGVRALGRRTGFDLEQPDTWRAAFAGARRAFYLTPPAHPDPAGLARAVFSALRDAGIEHVVNLTGFGVERAAASPLRQLELTLERSGLSFTHLRPNYFMQNFCEGPAWADLVERSEIAIAAADARISHVDVRDVAAVAAAVLTRDEWQGQALNLTGPESLDYGEFAQALTRALGRPIHYRALSEEQTRATLLAQGLAPARVEARLAFLALARQGAFSAISPDVERVLGRRARPLAAFVQDYRETWQAKV